MLIDMVFLCQTEKIYVPFASKFLHMSLRLPVFAFFIIALQTTFAQESSLAARTIYALEKSITFYHSISTEGGYVFAYTSDLTERWGEAPADSNTIEVQPPGTPVVGMAFLRAYKITKQPGFLQAAIDAASALSRGQNELGGWGHTIRFGQPLNPFVSFDDDQTQSAIRFLMALDEEIDDSVLTAVVDTALGMMLASQLPSGGWAHRYPYQGNYHDHATFNDGGINDCIKVMIQADKQYDRADIHASLEKVGRFMQISQLPPPQPGWAQQYNAYMQPAWARTFEPPSVCPQVTLLNIRSLMDLYLHTGNQTYLDPIPDALRWIRETRMPNGKWPRFVELWTNEPLYYDRGRIRVDSLSELSDERRLGYGYEQDLLDLLNSTVGRYEAIKQQGTPPPAADEEASPSPVLKQLMLESMKPLVEEVIGQLDDQGRWITKQDRFKHREVGKLWDGSYRTADRIHSKVFVRNVNLLCEYLEWLGK